MIQKLGEHRGAALIVAAFIILGTIYSLVTPVFEASDEIFHYPVVHHIQTHHQLPVQVVGQETDWEQEGSQPPLYYLLGAALTAWIDTGDMEARLWRNPHAKLGVPLDPDNKNMIIHTPAERYPWQGSVLAVHLMRFFGVALGAISVGLTYALTLSVFPGQKFLATTAAVLMAFNPMFLFISASVNNDNLIVPLATWTLLLLVRIISDGITTRRALTLAIVLALASITKISGLTLVPLAGLALLVRARRAGEWREAGLAGLAIIGAWLTLASWWYVRNLALYGELLGLRTHVAVAGGREVALGELAHEWYGFWVSFWGLFGSVNILLDRWAYTVYDVLFLLGVIGLGWWAWSGWRAGRCGDLLIPAGLLVYIGLVFVGVVRWTMQTYASQGRLMFPALGAITVLLARGLLTWPPPDLRRFVPWAIGLPMGLLAIVAPFRYIAPTYAPPPTVEQVPESATPVDVRFGDALELLAVETEDVVAYPGELVPITLYWRASEPMDTDYSLFLHLLGRDFAEIGKVDAYPGAGRLPTNMMIPGQIVVDSYAVRVEPEADAPTLARVQIGVWDFKTGEILDAFAPGGKVESVIVEAGLIVPRTPPQVSPAVEQAAQVGDFARLLGYDLSESRLAPGDELTIWLAWESLAPTPSDLTVFLHLAGSDGSPIVQADSPPLGGDYPTGLWQPGLPFVEQRALRIPDDAPPGEYRLLIGFYDANDPAYQRAPATGPDGQPYPNGAIPLSTPIEVVAR
jgi:4-amino-4-deoxy-L-arabinose transferase-like glycosyltransferase